MQMRLPAAVLALLLVLSGCGALPGGQPPSDERAVAERERAVSALDSVSTYRFAMDGTVSASDADRTRTVDVSGEGVVDRRRQRMLSNATADGTTRSVYLDGYTSYTECAEPWNGWGVDNASESTAWFDLTPLGRQMALLRESNVYWGGNETLDGTRTSVIVAHPSEETLASLPDTGRTTNGLSRGDVENATVRVWVDSETGRPVKSELSIALSAGGASGTVDVTVRYRSYDEPVNVSLPSSTRTDRYELGCPGE